MYSSLRMHHFNSLAKCTIKMLLGIFDTFISQNKNVFLSLCASSCIDASKKKVSGHTCVVAVQITRARSSDLNSSYCHGAATTYPRKISPQNFFFFSKILLLYFSCIFKTSKNLILNPSHKPFTEDDFSKKICNHS